MQLNINGYTHNDSKHSRANTAHHFEIIIEISVTLLLSSYLTYNTTYVHYNVFNFESK